MLIITIPFLMLFSLWVGIEGLDAYWDGLPGSFVVMGIGLGTFFVTLYYWVRLLLWPYFYSKGSETKQQKAILGSLFGLAIIGFIVFIVAFLRTQKFWTTVFLG
ncbi:MAG: hypothetical protein VXY77_00260 [Pseudomonadota bacterium]|nr:hypothetical protein [Pseudomonadota bacterium]